jgi:predicted O-methyltransferase YrrM
MNTAEIFRLLRLLPRRPFDALDQVAARLEAGLDRRLHPPPAYRSRSLETLIAEIEGTTGLALAPFLDERAAHRVEESLCRAMAEIGADAPLLQTHHGDLSFGRLCYVVCRAVRPSAAVETGVAYGVTSSFLLAALAANGGGSLHSIDRSHPEPGADELVGSLIPAPLKSRWVLHRGTSDRILPRLARELGAIGLFLHDSRHTYRNIKRELEAVTPFLAPAALVLADDVDRNAAFADWAAASRPRYWATLAEAKAGGLAGVAVFGKDLAEPEA